MSSNPINPVATCALCGSKAKLEQGHIVPRFVYRWREKVTGNKHSKPEALRDPRLHDGPKRPLLCGVCEDAFSAYESEFARWVFYPLATHSILNAKYQSWLRKFAVSVCWRILEDHLARNEPSGSAENVSSRLTSCREAWKQYLNGVRPDVGPYGVHLVRVIDVLDDASARLSVGETDDFHYTVEMEVSSSDPGAFVYAKLGPLVLFGLIEDLAPQSWFGTRINAEGKLKPCEISMPAGYRDYLFSRRAQNRALSIDRQDKTRDNPAWL